MKIIIETIPHDQQRYNTCGDWQFTDPNTLHIKVSEMQNNGQIRHEIMEAVVGLHEAVEALMCTMDDVTEKEVDAFDKDELYQKECKELDIEPGDHPKSPYKQQHSLATGIERILCAAFGIDWFEYENQLIEISEEE